MKLSEFIAKVEKRVPKRWAEDWDNPGLAFGDYEAEVSRTALALDASPSSVAAARGAGCELLFTHHPVLFRPAKSLTSDSFAGRTIMSAGRNDIALYSAHTNWDSSPEGVNFVLASLLALSDIRPLVPAPNGAWGMGAVGDFTSPVALSELCAILRERWRLSNFTLYGDGARLVTRLAVGGGACQDFWRDALHAGAEVFVTADVSYHFREEALDAGLSLVSCDHGEMERVSLPALRKLIEEETGLPVVVIDEAGPAFMHG